MAGTVELTESEPDVSVVIPTHNRRALLGMTLNSVLWQQGVTLEAIVVDEGSTDDTADRIKELRDRRVRLVRHDAPRGVSAARNHGIDVARGRWIAFLDDDDLWAPNKLFAQLHIASAAGATWVYAGSVKIDAHQRIIGGGPPPAPEALMTRLRSLNPACSSSAVASLRVSLVRRQTSRNPASPHLCQAQAISSPLLLKS